MQTWSASPCVQVRHRRYQAPPEREPGKDYPTRGVQAHPGIAAALRQQRREGRGVPLVGKKSGQPGVGRSRPIARTAGLLPNRHSNVHLPAGLKGPRWKTLVQPSAATNAAAPQGNTAGTLRKQRPWPAPRSAGRKALHGACDRSSVTLPGERGRKQAVPSPAPEREAG